VTTTRDSAASAPEAAGGSRGRVEGASYMSARAAGWLGAGIALGALVFAMPVLYVPGLTLMALAAGASMWVRLAAVSAAVEQSVERPMVVEGEPLGAEVRARSGRWPPPGGELRCDPLRIPLAPGSRVPLTSRVERRFERRGRHRLPAPTLRIADPLGLAERRVSGREHEVLVLPRVEQVRHLVAEGGGTSASRTLRGGAEENELDGLRPYRSGAPASRILWPTFARLGDLVERRLVTEADSTPLVILDAHAPESEAALDQAVRAAGSIFRTLASAGGARALLPGETRPLYVDATLRGWPAIWARLAVVGPAAAPPNASAPRSVTTLFWVTARAGNPRGRAVVDAAECFLVSPEIPTGSRPAFTVAGCGARRLRRSAEMAA
jgi:uncharacterized protein (DUF58 family)